MATAILSATQKNSFAKEYELPDAERRALRALADEPGGEISRLILLKVERQRINFIKLHGSAFGLRKTTRNLLQKNF